jgi:hypothetical protein
MNFTIIKHNGQLYPASDDDYEELAKMPSETPIDGKFTKIRCPETHRKYFAFLNKTWLFATENQRELFHNSRKQFRESIQNSVGYCRPSFNIKTNSWYDIPESISYEKLDEIEFQILYKKVKDACFELIIKHLEPQDYLDNFANFFKNG